MAHLRWTLEKFRIPLGKVLLIREVFVVASLAEILDCHWESMLARYLDPWFLRNENAPFLFR